MSNYAPVATAQLSLDADRLSTQASFDAKLAKADPGVGMYQLTLKLRLRLEPSYPSDQVKDASNKPFAIRPWTGPEWQTFLMGAKKQAELWKNRFWLYPVDDVRDYDWRYVIDRDGTVRSYLRPYIACDLDVDFNASAADAHRTIEVYNLDLAALTGTKDSGTFRSDEVHYDSLDNTRYATKYRDAGGSPVMHYTIAHEIGHAIGQVHIGATRKTPVCQWDMAADPDGGKNADACYSESSFDYGANIMGRGALFSEENAISWKWALRYLRGNPLPPENWRVLLTPPKHYGEIVNH